MITQKMVDNLKFTAIKSLKPDAQFNINSEGIVTFIDDTKLSNSKINEEMERIQQQYNDEEYIRNRVSEYPKIEDQLDMIYWDNINGTNIFKETIESIKTKFPK